MSIYADIFTGFSLGIASGSHCFWTCSMVMAPYLVVTDQTDHSNRWSSVPSAFRTLLWYHLGRLLAYIAAGVLAALISNKVRFPPFLHALVLLATALILGFSILCPHHPKRCHPRRTLRHPFGFAMGVLQGLTPCPPFIAAFGLALSSQSPLGGMMVFIFLFLGSSLFTLPLLFLGPLRRRKALYLAVRFFGFLVCVTLFIRAIELFCA